MTLLEFRGLAVVPTACIKSFQGISRPAAIVNGSDHRFQTEIIAQLYISQSLIRTNFTAFPLPLTASWHLLPPVRFQEFLFLSSLEQIGVE